jgi:endonuclease/exonuclease/phosphatase family metal-dependent hydrolase
VSIEYLRQLDGDQIHLKVQNFETTHEIIVGGDFNEDFSKYNNSRRANKMKTTMKECNLQTNFKGPTVINTQGIDVSEIDYFFFNKSDRATPSYPRLTLLNSKLLSESTALPIPLICSCISFSKWSSKS